MSFAIHERHEWNMENDIDNLRYYRRLIHGSRNSRMHRTVDELLSLFAKIMIIIWSESNQAIIRYGFIQNSNPVKVFRILSMWLRMAVRISIENSGYVAIRWTIPNRTIVTCLHFDYNKMKANQLYIIDSLRYNIVLECAWIHPNRRWVPLGDD